MRVSNWLAGMLAGMLAAGALAGPDYVQFDAEQLKSSPQSGWARPILFTDSVAAAVGEASKKLDRKFYAELTLATVGAAWVPEADLARFQGLAVGKTYSFGGTVDQIRGRYYVILDAVFELQTQEALEQQWTGLAGNGSATTNDPVVQALLIESQNRLIRMAQENNMTVAELVGAQTDGGHRIVENIVADSLQAQLQANNQTAEQVMVDAVMALLQKQAALEGVADVAENAALPSPDQIEQLLDQGQASGTQADDEDALFVETDDEPAVEAPSEDWWKGVGEEILAMPQSPEVPATPEPTAVEVELPAIDVAVAEGETGEGTSESAETEGTPEAAAGSADDLLADLVPSLDQEPAAGEDEAVVELPEAGDMAGSEVAEVPLEVPAETAAANEPGEQVESVAEPVEPFEPVATAEVAGDTKLAGDEVAAMLPPTVDVAMNAEVPGKGRLVPAIDSGLVRPLDGGALVPMVSAMPTEAELVESARLAREQAAAAKAEAKRLEKEAEEEAKRLEKERRAAEKEAQRIEREARRAEEELREREEEARKAAEKEAARKLREAQREAEKRQEALEEALAEQQAAAVDAAKQSARLESSRAALAALREENARQMAELEVRRATAEAALVAASNTTAEAIAKAQAAVEAASQQQLSQLEADTTATLAALQQQLTEAAAISDEELAAANATMAQLEEGRALADQEAEQLAEASQAAKAAEADARDAEKAAEQAVKDAAKAEREARQKVEKELRAQAEAAEKAAKKAEEEAAEAEQRARAETEPAAEEKGWFARWSERRAAAAAEKAARRAEEEAREAEEEAREKAEKERRAAEKALRKEEERQRKEAEKQRKEEEKRLQEEEKARLAAEKAAAARAAAASGDFGDIYAPVEW
ncbi:MAG: hypothetical protein ILO10_03015 [Kiritimatiellae bacterium]|nr:hypothetical protein [Kiritimatiellia bacterium]